MTSEAAPGWVSPPDQTTAEYEAAGQTKPLTGSFQRGRFQVGIIKSRSGFYFCYFQLALFK